MNEDLTIRLVQTNDAQAIAEIYRPYVEGSAVSFELAAPESEEIQRRIRNTMQKHAWLVCETDNAIAGYAYAGTYRERIAYQWVAEVSIYVHPHYRRKSVASALYQALHEILKEQGYFITYAIMTLPNEASRNFHLSFGYQSFACFENSGYKLSQWHSTEWFFLTLRTTEETPENIVPIHEMNTSLLNQICTKAAQSIRTH